MYHATTLTVGLVARWIIPMGNWHQVTAMMGVFSFLCIFSSIYKWCKDLDAHSDRLDRTVPRLVLTLSRSNVYEVRVWDPVRNLANRKIKLWYRHVSRSFPEFPLLNISIYLCPTLKIIFVFSVPSSYAFVRLNRSCTDIFISAPFWK